MEFGEKGITKDIDVLQPDTDKFRPSDLPEREEELEQIHSVIHPVTIGGTPSNALVYGPTGQGKTVGVELKMEELQRWTEEEEADINITVAYISCKGCDNSYNVLTTLVKGLREIRRGPGEDKPSGHPRKTLIEMAFDELREMGGAIILVLDEIDAIGDDDYVLYELSRASIEGVRLGVIGITNDLQFRRGLDADVRSSLGKNEIHFPPYDAIHLQDILARRAVGALRSTRFTDGVEDYHHFESDVLDSSVIPKCAALAAQDTGDARRALEILLEAVKNAMKGGEERVTEEHVEEAYDSLEREAIEQGIRSETVQRKLALLTVTIATVDDDTPSSTRRLYTRYQNYCETIDAEERTMNNFREKLNDLVHSNILSKERRGRGKDKGITNLYQLSVDEDLVFQSLDSDNNDRLEVLLATLKEKYR